MKIQITLDTITAMHHMLNHTVTDHIIDLSLINHHKTITVIIIIAKLIRQVMRMFKPISIRITRNMRIKTIILITIRSRIKIIEHKCEIKIQFKSNNN